MNSCLAVIAITAAMIIDGDAVRLDGRTCLTGADNVPFDTPETWRPGCPSEAKLGARATGLLRSLMPGTLCIIGEGQGGYGRNLGVLYGRDRQDVRGHLIHAGLAKTSKNAEWCD